MSTPLVSSSEKHPKSCPQHVQLEKRKAEAERIRQKYPDRIPVSRL